MQKTEDQELLTLGGFEPPKLSRQIYSLIPLTAREPLQKDHQTSFFLALFYTEAAFYGN